MLLGTAASLLGSGLTGKDFTSADEIAIRAEENF